VISGGPRSLKKTRAGRRITSLKYTGRGIHKSLSRLRVPTTLVAILLVGLSIFLLGGGVYDIISNPISIIPMPGRLIAVYPYYIHEQTLTASIGVMILYAVGTAGFIMLYEGTKYVRKPRQASILILVGITLIVLAFIFMEALLHLKIHPS